MVLKWENTRASGLGEPLPAGQVRVFEIYAGGMVFAGEARIDDRPVGLPVEARIARALDLVAEFTLDEGRLGIRGRQQVRDDRGITSLVNRRTRR